MASGKKVLDLWVTHGYPIYFTPHFLITCWMELSSKWDNMRLEVHYETEEAAKQADGSRLNPLSNILRWYRFVSKWRVHPANSNFYRENMGTWSWNSGFLVGLDANPCLQAIEKVDGMQIGEKTVGEPTGVQRSPADLGWRRNITRCPMPGLSQGYS